ncbi:acyltransferase [Plantibacter flavus]|uniref:acyltransferase family protein n=1 Tax=Plantibacter flavus TaxID=150123 RepID=UPI003F171002
MSTPAASGVIRADIQGLRAVAVALVVLFHLRPGLVPGGYVGVDVFFAISGFLITAHLLRELEHTGTVRLGRFWARRARRLLPAALTVLLVVLAASVLVAPIGDLPRFIRETMWSALYIENWALAGSAVDYLAAESSPSPVQHYWSLSVEEQFYLVWPVLLLAAAWFAARVTGRREGHAGRSSTRLRRSALVVLLAVFAASLTWSVVFTAEDPSPAYFVTTTRAWEFAAGGLVAVLVAGTARWSADRQGIRIAVAWAGLVAVGLAAFGYSGATPFPSMTALLPVAGALAVVWAAAPATRSSPTALLAVRPVQWLGDRSYAVYLWHWPVIILAGFALGRSASILEQIVLMVFTLLLAEATTRWVEQPIRFGVPSRWSPARVLGLTAAAMAVLLAVSAVALPQSQARIVAEQSRLERLVAAPPDCFGAAELLDEARCDDAAAPGELGPGTATSATVPDASLADTPPDRCITDIRADAFAVCAYGAAADTATRTVALIGDSHAEQWLPAFADAAESGG